MRNMQTFKRLDLYGLMHQFRKRFCGELYFLKHNLIEEIT